MSVVDSQVGGHSLSITPSSRSSWRGIDMSHFLPFVPISCTSVSVRAFHFTLHLSLFIHVMEERNKGTHTRAHTRTQKQPLQITHAHTNFVVCEYNDEGFYKMKKPDKGFSIICFSTHTHAQTITMDNTHTHARTHTVLDPLKGAQHKHKHLMIVWSIKSLVFIHFDNLDEDLITCRFSRMS